VPNLPKSTVVNAQTHIIPTQILIVQTQTLFSLDIDIQKLPSDKIQCAPLEKAFSVSDNMQTNLAHDKKSYVPFVTVGI
jgi:hypothetical protein